MQFAVLLIIYANKLYLFVLKNETVLRSVSRYGSVFCRVAVVHSREDRCRCYLGECSMRRVSA